MKPHRRRRILVLNPNSSSSVTALILDATLSLGLAEVEFSVDQLDAGPPSIETARDHAAAVPLVADYVSRRSAEFDAFVIACHGDPGVARARESVRYVFGIGETSMLVACAYADRFGLLTLGQALVKSKYRQVHAAGLDSRCASIEPTGTGVLDGASSTLSLEPYLRAAHRALARGAGALVLGCAGMVQAASGLAQALSVPVIEPVAATCLVAVTVPADTMAQGHGKRQA